MKRGATILFCALFAAPLTYAQRGMMQGPVGQPATTQADALKDVGFDQRLDETLPLDLPFRDEQGQTVTLRQYFGKRPAIIAPVYYECPMLCSQILNGLISGLKGVLLQPGKDFEVIVVSFDPRETPVQAAKRKDAAMGRFAKPGSETGFHFLTGDEESVRAVTAALGFRYTWDEDRQQFAHASGIVVATLEGKLSRYLYGVEYAPRDIRFALLEASENKIGSPIDKLLLFCYHYDPATGKYTTVALNILRLAATATLLALVSFLFIMFRRDRRARHALAGAPR
ncbi:MAG: SCO family protein [Bryobacterales bacterium]|nr:SCO family protein [Bryobacterales bacterium]